MLNVDILLICYNQEEYISQALESIFMQRTNNISVRIIIADDFSKDNTVRIIKEYEKKSPFPFIYLSSSQNLGHIANYKRAFAACAGDYVCVLEGDDYWTSPYHIEKHVRCLYEHREVAMSVNKIVLYYQEEHLYHIRENISDAELCYVTTKDHILQNRIDNHSACCYRTELLRNVPDKIFGDTFDDWLLGIYMSQHGFIAQLKDVTSLYRIHNQGIWSGETIKKQNEKVLANIDIADKIFNGIYHNEMQEATQIIKKRIMPSKHKIVDWIPLWAISIYHGIIPPIIRQWLRV